MQEGKGRRGGEDYKLSANKLPLQMQMPNYEVHQKLGEGFWLEISIKSNDLEPFSTAIKGTLYI